MIVPLHNRACEEEALFMKVSGSSTTKLNFHADRRRHVRYPIHGSLVLLTETERYTAEPIDLSIGGVLFKADRLPPVNATGALELNVDGFGEIITASVDVNSVRGELASAIFLESNLALVRCVAWLNHKEAEEIQSTG
jgi:PilZ domain-containing protein